MSRFSEVLHRAAHSACRYHGERYVDLPPVVDINFEVDPRRGHVTLFFYFPEPVKKFGFDFPVNVFSDRYDRPVHAVLDQARSYASEQYKSELLDFYQREDDRLLGNTFFSLNLGEYSAYRLYEQFRETLRSYYSTLAQENIYPVPFFTLRDEREEECRWQDFLATRHNLLDRRALRNNDDLEFPVTIRWSEPDQDRVRLERERVIGEITAVLLCQENPYFFHRRLDVLRPIDRERVELLSRQAWPRRRDYSRISDHQLVGLPSPEAWEREIDFRHIDRRVSETFFGFDPARGRDRTAYYGDFVQQPSSRSPEAEARGLKLLEESLSKSQLKQFKKERRFVVKGGKTGHKYEITSHYQMNVFRIEKDGKRQGLCFIPVGNLCLGDVMLAQKIGIELYEEEILRVARPFAS